MGGRLNGRRGNNFWEVNAADLDVILMTRIQGSGTKSIFWDIYHFIVMLWLIIVWLTQIKENTLTESSGHQWGDLKKLWLLK